MRWTPGGVSDDVEDRRGDSGGGFGGFGAPHMGIGGFLVLLVLSLVFHKNLFTIFTGGPTTSDRPVSSAPPGGSPAENKEVEFVSFVLDDVQHTWEKLLPAQTGTAYRHAKLVLYRDALQSPCGLAQTAVGPFYCPGDEKVYIDLAFFDELRSRFRAPGEFAQAYVIAHEIGHHVQKLLGIEGKVHHLQRQDPSQANPLSVRMELQADCFAGAWANTTAQRNIIDQSDIEAGLRAAAAVGDDRLQRQSTGRVSPDSFTHGTSAQRTHWFQQGLESGHVKACDTFNTQR